MPQFNFAFVEFDTAADAQKAIKLGNGKLRIGSNFVIAQLSKGPLGGNTRDNELNSGSHTPRINEKFNRNRDENRRDDSGQFSEDWGISRSQRTPHFRHRGRLSNLAPAATHLSVPINNNLIQPATPNFPNQSRKNFKY